MTSERPLAEPRWSVWLVKGADQALPKARPARPLAVAMEGAGRERDTASCFSLAGAWCAPIRAQGGPTVWRLPLPGTGVFSSPGEYGVAERLFCSQNRSRFRLSPWHNNFWFGNLAQPRAAFDGALCARGHARLRLAFVPTPVAPSAST